MASSLWRKTWGDLLGPAGCFIVAVACVGIGIAIWLLNGTGVWLLGPFGLVAFYTYEGFRQLRKRRIAASGKS